MLAWVFCVFFFSVAFLVGGECCCVSGVCGFFSFTRNRFNKH